MPNNFHSTDKATSERMKKIRTRNTGPELVVRKLLFAMGYRYRVNVETLPGKPDIVFTKKKKIIFVHGCFWHGHEKCKRAKLPKTNTEFWRDKQSYNKKKDKENILELIESGWTVLVLWECQLILRQSLVRKIQRFLKN